MPDPREPKLLVHRKTADGETQVGTSWESLIERQIREAMDEGKFDNLPYQGQPLPNDENPYAGDRGLAFHVLRNAGVAPPWIEADKEVRELLAKREAIFARAAADPPPTSFARQRDRKALEELVVQLNAAIARVNAEAPTDRQHRRPLRLADELGAYDAAARR
jgi:DnaJ family protein C protein 28